jgi:CheY-like chemotaxis protein
LELVRSDAVKVLVVDQRMPVSGTDLYRQIRDVDPRIRAIMLTGEADVAEVGAAVTLGFKDYLRKADVRRLPDRVLQQYAEYMSEAASEGLSQVRPVLFARGARTWFRRRGGGRVEYRLLGIRQVEAGYSPPAEWVTVLTLHTGQTERLEYSFEVERTLVLERETTDKLTSRLGLSNKDVVVLEARLETELSERHRKTSTVRARQTRTIERTFQLPAEPTDPNQLHVQLRRIQQAPVYERIRADLLVSCECCRLQNVVRIELLWLTAKRALRREDRLSDGSARISELGIE